MPRVDAAEVAPECPPGAQIESVVVENGNIFNTDDPAESALPYRLANRLHPVTWETVIRRALSFDAGDLLNPADLAESERILRAKRNIQSADITYTCADAAAQVRVVTRDTWSAKPTLAFSQKAGSSQFEFGLEDHNLLGSGISAALGYRSDPDRDSLIVQLRGAHLGPRTLATDLLYAANSDGHDA